MSVLERVRALIPIQFRYVPEVDPAQLLRAGFSAQQVRDLFPDAVTEVNGILAIKPDVLRRYIIQAAKEQQQLNHIEKKD